MARYKDLKSRTVTAIPLIGGFAALLIGAAYSTWGTILMAVVGIVALLIAAYEYTDFSTRELEKRDVLVSRLLRFLMLTVAPLLVVGGFIANHTLPLGLSITIAVLTFGCGLFLAGRTELFFVRDYVQTTSVALIHVGICGAFLVSLPLVPEGASRLLVLVAVVAANDIAAYFGGSRLKGPKFAPALSPNKTISGSICGFIAGALVIVGLHYIIRPTTSLVWDIVLGLVVVFAAQLGDLSKSYLKRIHGVKDTGAILPGHGGILDRIDGILAGAPFLFFWW